MSNAINDLSQKRFFQADHVKSIKHSDGSSIMEEKSIEFSDKVFCQSDHWLWNPEKPDIDKKNSAYRQDESSISIINKKTEIDSKGNKTTENQAAISTDFWSSNGTSLIIDAPDTSPDPRKSIIASFASGQNLLEANSLLLGDAK